MADIIQVRVQKLNNFIHVQPLPMIAGCTGMPSSEEQGIESAGTLFLYRGVCLMSLELVEKFKIKSTCIA